MSVNLSKHGERRMKQRGFRQTSAELIRRCGTPIDDVDSEVYFLRDKDIDAQVHQLKQEMQTIERLRGCKAVFAGDTLVTVVRAGRSHEKTLLRRMTYSKP
jgi:hypothetical protein